MCITEWVAMSSAASNGAVASTTPHQLYVTGITLSVVVVVNIVEFMLSLITCDYCYFASGAVVVDSSQVSVAEWLVRLTSM